MHTLYDSESFTVTHMLAAIETADGKPAAGERTDAPKLALVRHGFEIVDKRSGKEVYLEGSWAELFEQRLAEWQRSSPTQEEVEDTLEQYAGLAQTPVSIH